MPDEVLRQGVRGIFTNRFSERRPHTRLEIKSIDQKVPCVIVCLCPCVAKLSLGLEAAVKEYWARFCATYEHPFYLACHFVSIYPLSLIPGDREPIVDNSGH